VVFVLVLERICAAPMMYWKTLIHTIVHQAEDEPFQVILGDKSFETYELEPPPYTIETTKKDLKQMYYDMTVIRYAGLNNRWCKGFC
jgi:hypothetical protein